MARIAYPPPGAMITAAPVPLSTIYGVKVGTSDKKFDFHFKTEHFKMLPGDYGVYISSKLISNFRHKNKTLQYWIALENTSKYEG